MVAADYAHLAAAGAERAFKRLVNDARPVMFYPLEVAARVERFDQEARHRMTTPAAVEQGLLPRGLQEGLEADT